MKKILSLLMLSAVGTAQAVTNPSSVLLKIYEVRLSPNADCSQAVTIFTNPSGASRDLVQNPTLGSGAIPNGTYQCFMAHISDQIIYTPAASDGAMAASEIVNLLKEIGDRARDPHCERHPR